MGEGYLYQVIPFLKELDEERRKQFEEYFQTAPIWLMDAFQVVKFEKGEIFVQENTPVDTIYFIGKGMVKATDYRVYGIAYDFMRFEDLQAIGGMEVIMNIATYRATLETITPCQMIKISRKQFEKWLFSDIVALRREAQIMGRSLLDESRKGRVYLFQTGMDRLAGLFMKRFELHASKGVLVIENTRQELSDETGLSVKTVNRAVKKLEEENLIGRCGRKIIIDETQYRKLKRLISNIADT